MPIIQEVWSLDEKCRLESESLNSETELEDFLCGHIEILDPDWLVIGRQVKTSAGKFIDLLCMDRDGEIIVIELKRNLTPREVTAQVIDYASCVDKMEPEELAEVYLAFSKGKDTLNSAYEKKYGSVLDDNSINQNVKMVIVASEMDDSTDRIITYLREKYLVDINIVFFNIFRNNEKRFISRAWFQENGEIQTVTGSSQTVKWNHEFYVSFGSGERKWTDAKNHGFISAGGGYWYIRTLKMLSVGDRVWVNIPHTGYVGVGIVNAEVQQARTCILKRNGGAVKFSDLSLDGKYLYADDDPDRAEYIVGIDWIHTVSENQAVRETGFFGNQNTVCRPTTSKWTFTIERLKHLWNIDKNE